MTTQSYVVNINDQEVTVRMGNVVVPGVRVSSATFGKVQVMGGISGPPGPPGADGMDGSALLTSHISDSDPHPAYDDLPSMTLLFENGLV